MSTHSTFSGTVSTMNLYPKVLTTNSVCSGTLMYGTDSEMCKNRTKLVKNSIQLDLGETVLITGTNQVRSPWSRPWCSAKLLDEIQLILRIVWEVPARHYRHAATNPNMIRRVDNGTSICLDHAMQTLVGNALEFLRRWVPHKYPEHKWIKMLMRFSPPVSTVSIVTYSINFIQVFDWCMNSWNILCCVNGAA